MRPIPIVGYNNVLTPPAAFGWDFRHRVKDNALYVRSYEGSNAVVWSHSAWLPSPGELFKMQHGCPLILTVYGTAHPPVWVGIGLQEDIPPDYKVAQNILTEINETKQ